MYSVTQHGLRRVEAPALDGLGIRVLGFGFRAQGSGFRF